LRSFGNCADGDSGGQRSLRDISAELAQRGILNEREKRSRQLRSTRCLVRPCIEKSPSDQKNPHLT
jgi:hypothetical protein